MFIKITKLKCKEYGNALRSIASFLDEWKGLDRVEIVLEDC